MDQNVIPALSGSDLNAIRDAVPTLDLFAIRSLRRAGFAIVKNDDADPLDHDASETQEQHWEDARHRISSAA